MAEMKKMQEQFFTRSCWAQKKTRIGAIAKAGVYHRFSCIYFAPAS